MTVIESVQEIVAEANGVIERLASDVGPSITARPPSAADIVATVEATMRRVLEEHPLIVGGGFVAGPALLGVALMAWWQALGQQRRIERLDSGATGAGDYLRSYEDIEWYRVPQATGSSHMTGPYVDYLCTDDATLTFTAPAGDGAFAGVLGVDVFARDFERVLQPRLREAHERALLLTDEHRVAASCDPDVIVQSRLSSAQLDELSLEPVAGTQFSLAVPR